MLKKLREERDAKHKAMKQLIDTANTENRDLTAEECSKFDALSERASECDAQIKRHEQVEAAEQRHQEQNEQERRDAGAADDLDGRPQEQRMSQDELEALEARHREAVNAALREGYEHISAEHRQTLAQANARNPELRVNSIGGIGVVGTRRVYSTLVEAMLGFTGVREAGANVIATADGNPFTVPTSDDTGNTGELIVENPSSDTDSADPVIGNAALDAYTISSKGLGVSFQLLQDNEFDVEAHLMDLAGERIGRTFNTLTTNGTGSSQPRGFVTAATANRHEAGANDVLGYDDLLDLMDTVDAAYQKDPSAGFMMNQRTLTEARKLKDSNGTPIWNPAMGERGETIHGYPVHINNDLGLFGATANTVVAAFGCWRKYFIRDVTRPYIVRDPYTSAGRGLVKFFVFSRHGGQLTDTKAVGLLDLPAA